MWRSRTFLPAVKVKPVLQATVSLIEKFRFPIHSELLKLEQKVVDVCQNRPSSPSVERYPSVATNFYRTINLYGCQP